MSDLVTDLFRQNEWANLALLERIEARTILPGHGDPWAGGGADAVAAARLREYGRSSARR